MFSVFSVFSVCWVLDSMPPLKSIILAFITFAMSGALRFFFSLYKKRMLNYVPNVLTCPMFQKCWRALRDLHVPKIFVYPTCRAKNVGVHYVSCQKCWRAVRALCVPHFDVFYMFYMPKTLTSPKCHMCSQTACHTYLTCAMCQKFNVSYTANTQKVNICEEKSDVK